MENFFIDENFYSELSELAEYLELDEDSIKDLPDDYLETAEESTFEPIFKANDRFFEDLSETIVDWYEDRLPEESDGVIKKIELALKSSIDMEKLNSLLPKMYYPNGVKFKITKADLLETL